MQINSFIPSNILKTSPYDNKLLSEMNELLAKGKAKNYDIRPDK